MYFVRVITACGITGSKMELMCEIVSISLNKNAIYGDRSALSPGGVRIGTPALTSRGFTEDSFKTVAGFLQRCVEICVALFKLKPEVKN